MLIGLAGVGLLSYRRKKIDSAGAGSHKDLLHIAAQLQLLANGWVNDRTAVNEIGSHIEALEDIRRRLKKEPQAG